MGEVVDYVECLFSEGNRNPRSRLACRGVAKYRPAHVVFDEFEFERVVGACCLLFLFLESLELGDVEGQFGGGDGRA